MFRRIFGIGKKKGSKHQTNDISASSVAAGVLSDSKQSNPAVVPLHGESVVKKKKEPAEVFNEAVDKLVDKLENINSNLDTQIQQNQKLVERMDTLPELLNSLPESVQQQQKAFADVADQMRQKVQRDEKVAQQLSGIHEKVAASTEIDTQMYESFKMFSGSLAKLDEDTTAQTEWLRQMSNTFSSNEQYIKFTVEKQQKRFYWVLGISLGVCIFAVAALAAGMIMLLR